MLANDEDYDNASGGSGSEDEELEEHGDVRAYYIPLCILAAVIVLVNSFILILVWRNMKLRTNCNALLVSLAFADSTTGLVGIPLLVVLELKQDIPPRCQCFMRLSLHTWFWFMSICSIFHLLVIACEQYLAILKPFSHDKIVTKGSTMITLAIIWGLSIAHALIPWTWIVPGDDFCDDVSDATLKKDKIYTITSIVLFFVLPIAIIIYVYCRIVMEAKRQLGRIRRESVVSKGKYRNFSSCTRFRGFYIIALMWLAFVLCWAPYFGSVFYETFYDRIQKFWLNYKLSVLRFLPSLLNPIMFAFWRSDFRAACIEKFCCCVKQFEPSRSSVSSGKQQILMYRLSDSKQPTV